MMTTPTKKGQQAGSSKDVPQKHHRRRAMTSKEILDMKKALKDTPKKSRPGIMISDPSSETTIREIVLEETSVFKQQKFITQPATEKFWDQNLTEWQNKMEQVKVYIIINNNKLSQGEVDIICLAAFNYTFWESTLPNVQDTKLIETINRKLPTPGYNPAKGISWLVKPWPTVVEYITKGDIYDLPQAEIQEETDPVQRKLFEKPWEIDDSDIEDDLEKEQSLGSIEELISEIITLKTLLEETMDANQKLQDRVKYLEKKYTKGKKKITFEDEIVDISSDGDDEGEEPSRKTRNPTPSMLEYEQITGIKQRVGQLSKELKNATNFAKIRDPPVCNGKDPKWRSPTQFDDWFADVVDWLDLQRIDVRKPLPLGRVGCLLSENAKLWYRRYREKNPEESWNLHEFILILRSKLVPTTAPNKL